MNDPNKIDRVEQASPDLKEGLRRDLRNLIPEAFSEGHLDTEKLKSVLGESADTSPERYSFTWSGKRDAIAMLQAPTRATLVPDRENSVNFDEAQHVFIEGENLEVLKVLYRSYFGCVKMIYIDPPYNTGKDFIYPDDFSDPLDNYLRITGQKNGNGDYESSKVDTSGRVHSAWLSMMYPRLVLARQLLMEDGVLFVSIDDKELGNLVRLLDEVFGEENRVGIISWRNVTDNNPTLINNDNEFIVCYAKDKPTLPESWKSRESDEKELLLKFYTEKKAEGLSAQEI
jgi:adenine-specific DNA-methyltransferase